MSSHGNGIKKGLVLVLLIARAGAQTAANWTQASPQTSPPDREYAGMTYDAAHGQVVLYGGSFLPPNAFISQTLDDTWVWEGSNWTRKSPQTSPGARETTMVYDSAHRQVVLFGGRGFAVLNDTWVWDGNNWTQKFPTTSPSARSGHSMAYDSARGQVVLFGGSSVNDTWVWDGNNWTRKLPLTSPPARTNSSMAYDSAHGQVVLFGGSVGNGLNDTWVWDGANWTQKAVSGSSARPKAVLLGPSARANHAMAYDSTRNQVVLFGGAASIGVFFNDTWVWDGFNWTKESPQVSPPTRFGHAMAYDSTHDQIVLFGGGEAIGVHLTDTWTWNGGPIPITTPPPIVPAITSIQSAGSFGAFPTVAPGTWVEIYGSNLSGTTRGWAGSDFSGNSAPTVLDGVQVTIGGQKAFIDYIATSPGQVNAQLPSNVGTGTQQVTVTSGGVTSVAFNVIVNATQPDLLAPPVFKIGGNQYVVATLPDGNYVLPRGAIPGANSRPAQPGETIVIYGIGFGSVIPAISAGQIATQSNQLAATFQMSFGKTPARVDYFGLAPNFVGLYQFNIVVPVIPDSDLVPLTFTLGGVSGAQTLYTSVRR